MHQSFFVGMTSSDPTPAKTQCFRKNSLSVSAGVDEDVSDSFAEEEEDHSTYFERSACAIADVAGPENDHYRFMNNQNNANCGNTFTFSQQQPQQFFKKGRKLLLHRSKGPSF